jgi:uncharacterized protein
VAIRFTWDKGKAKSNLAKHGVSFESASQVFTDPYLLVLEDRIDGDGELRFHALGRVNGGLVLVVVFVDRSSNEQEVYRIISARKAQSYEESTYTDQF